MTLSQLRTAVTRLRMGLARCQVVYGRRRGILMGLLAAIGVRRSSLVRTQPGGLPHRAYIRNTFCDESVVYQVFGNHDYDLEYPTAPTTIIDAGANIGMASLYLSQRFPDARILAVEPDPENFAILSLNTAMDSNIICLKGAVWTERGEIELLDPGTGPWGFQARSATSARASPNHIVRRSSVDAFTIADLMELLDTDRIDLLKMDIEGGEREVFADSGEWIDSIDQIAIELHDDIHPGCRAAVERATAQFSRHERKGENHYFVR